MTEASKEEETLKEALRVRMEAVKEKHPKFKFQVGQPRVEWKGSYPIYVWYLVAPFVYESGEGDDLRRDMSDARVPIIMTKAEKSGPGAEGILLRRKLEAANLILDMVEENRIPRCEGRWSEATYWGTLQDLFPDNPKQFPNQ